MKQLIQIISVLVIILVSMTSSDLLPSKAVTPAQVVFANINDTNQQVSMVVLGNTGSQALSPAWYYVMMVVVLLGALLWNDDLPSYRNKDKKT